MESTGISRRDALVVAGATAALAACGKEGTAGASAAETLAPEKITTTLEAFAQSLGITKHGDGPKDDYPHRGKPGYATYSSGHFMIIYIGSRGSWSIEANHAVFEYTKATPADRLAEALDILRKKKGDPSKRFSEYGPVVAGQWPGQTTPAKRDHLQFQALGFGSQHDIFIYFDHKANEIQFDPALDNVVIFSEYQYTGKPTAENRAFYNLKQLKGQSGLTDGTLFTLENWFTGNDGKPIPKGYDIYYKMNFLYVAKNVPMLIDPDTGNGTSWQP